MMGERKMGLLIRRNCRGRGCKPTWKSFLRAVQKPWTCTATSLLTTYSPMSGGQLPVQNELQVFPTETAPQSCACQGTAGHGPRALESGHFAPPWPWPSWLRLSSSLLTGLSVSILPLPHPHRVSLFPAGAQIF